MPEHTCGTPPLGISPAHNVCGVHGEIYATESPAGSGRYAGLTARFGNTTRNVVPASSVDVTPTRPPWIVAM